MGGRILGHSTPLPLEADALPWLGEGDGSRTHMSSSLVLPLNHWRC